MSETKKFSSTLRHIIIGLVALLLFPAGIAQAQKGKPSKPAGGSGPCTVLFSNTGVEAIVDEGKGQYVDGADGTRCTVNAADGSGTSGDFLFTLNNKKGAKTSRSAVMFLENPVEGSESRGVWVVSGQFHLKIKRLGEIEVGQTILHRAGFHVPYLGVNYKFRYGWDEGDGTALTRITRHSTSVWTIESLDSHTARLWTGGSYGDGTVYDQQGDYIAPFRMTITLK